MRQRPPTDRERFDCKWKLDTESGCWLWLAAVCQEGYGRFKMNRARQKAHRVAWELYRGPIPEGLVIDHMCRVRSCVNPDHLRIVTRRTNVLENSVGLAAQNITKAYCPRGHPLAGNNLRTAPENGTNAHSRRCRTCHNAKARTRRAALKQRTASS